MKKIQLIAITTTLAVLSSAIAKADSAIYPGNLDKPSYLGVDPKRKGHVIEACKAYMEAIDESRNPEENTISEQEHKDRIAKAKEELMKRIETYPDEINDTHWSAPNGLEASPFYAAVYGNDCDLLEYVLNKGALPFMPEYCYSDLELSRDVKAILYHARSQYNILEICLKARKAGIKIEGEEPSDR